jgi:hypothetical protein
MARARLVSAVVKASVPIRARSNELRLKLRRFQHLRTLLSEHPTIFLPFARWTHPAGPIKVVSTDTQIVIEGFTRSASTFAVIAFQLAQPAPIRVARHLHAPAHLIAGAKKGLPVIACVRPPEATVLSAVIRSPNLTIPHLLWSYARFYEKILPYRPSFVVATFEEVTGDFGGVIDRVNDQFGTRFSRFHHTEANVAKVFHLIEQRSGKPSWVKVLGDYQSGLIGTDELYMLMAEQDEQVAVDEKVIARPSEVRKNQKAALRRDYHHPRLDQPRRRAEDAYEAFVPG